VRILLVETPMGEREIGDEEEYKDFQLSTDTVAT